MWRHQPAPADRTSICRAQILPSQRSRSSNNSSARRSGPSLYVATSTLIFFVMGSIRQVSPPGFYTQMRPQTFEVSQLPYSRFAAQPVSASGKQHRGRVRLHEAHVCRRGKVSSVSIFFLFGYHSLSTGLSFAGRNRASAVQPSTWCSARLSPNRQ